MKGRSCGVVAGIVAAVVIAAGVVLLSAYRAANVVPVIAKPIIKLPSPNAYDYFAKARKLLPKDIEAEVSKYKYSQQQKEVLVRQNSRALQIVRQGLGCGYVPPFKYGVNATYPEYGEYRYLARLLQFESEAQASRGDWQGAMNSSLDGMLMGAQIPHGCGVMGKLVGNGIQNMCRRSTWLGIDHLSSAQAKSAVSRLEDIAQHEVRTDKVLEEEKLEGLLGLQDMLAGKCKDQDFLYVSKMSNRAKRKTLVGFAAYMDASIAAVCRPYATHPAFPEFKRPSYFSILSGDAVPSILLATWCPSCDLFWFSDVRTLTQNRLLVAALALRAYKTEKGAYPDKLTDLVPGYLKSLPQDPYAMKGSFGYRREGDKYVLWSVGPDCKDDGGKAINQGPADNQRAIDGSSKGDIVAGMND